MQSFTGKNKSILSVTLAVGILVGMLGWSNAVQAEQPSANRFVVLPPGDWVLDTTTALKWQQTPGSANVVGDGASCNGPTTCVWQEAVDYCAALGKKSRLPEVPELQSLVDFSVAQQTHLIAPNGPFAGVQAWVYWLTEVVGDPAQAWTGGFNVAGSNNPSLKGNNWYVWCVR